MTHLRAIFGSTAGRLLLGFVCLTGCGSNSVGTEDAAPVADVAASDTHRPADDSFDVPSADDSAAIVDALDAPSTVDATGTDAPTNEDTIDSGAPTSEDTTPDTDNDVEAGGADRCYDPELSTHENPARPCPCVPRREGGTDVGCCARNIPYSCSQYHELGWIWSPAGGECWWEGESAPDSRYSTPCPWVDDPFSDD